MENEWITHNQWVWENNKSWFKSKKVCSQCSCVVIMYELWVFVQVIGSYEWFN